MMEIATMKGKVKPVEKKILEKFKDALVPNKEHGKIFDVLTLKSKISTFD